MKHNLDNIMKTVEKQIEEITGVDTDLLKLYQNFSTLESEEKEQAADRYEDLLEDRNNMIHTVLDIQEYLSSIVSDLNNVKLSKFDRLSHWMKLRKLKKSISNIIDIEDAIEDDIEDTKSTKQDDMVNIDQKEKERLKYMIEEVKKERMVK